MTHTKQDDHYFFLKELFHLGKTQPNLTHELFLTQALLGSNSDPISDSNSDPLCPTFDEIIPFDEFMATPTINLNQTTVVFDTSALLNLYRFSESQFKALEDGLENASVVIPSYVVLEWKQNRNSVSQQTEFEGTKQVFIENLDNLLNSHLIGSEDAIDSLKKQVTDVAKVTPEEVDAFVKNNYKPDPFFQRDTEIKIGDLGDKRYSKKFPPGYGDEKGKKGTDKYMDLFIWGKVLEQGRKNQPVIYVCDDKKEQQRSGMTTRLLRAEFSSLYPHLTFDSVDLAYFMHKYIWHNPTLQETYPFDHLTAEQEDKKLQLAPEQGLTQRELALQGLKLKFLELYRVTDFKRDLK